MPERAVDMPVRGTRFEETFQEWLSELQTKEAQVHRGHTILRLLSENR